MITTLVQQRPRTRYRRYGFLWYGRTRRPWARLRVMFASGSRFDPQHIRRPSAGGLTPRHYYYYEYAYITPSKFNEHVRYRTHDRYFPCTWLPHKPRVNTASSCMSTTTIPRARACNDGKKTPVRARAKPSKETGRKSTDGGGTRGGGRRRPEGNSIVFGRSSRIRCRVSYEQINERTARAVN